MYITVVSKRQERICAIRTITGLYSVEFSSNGKLLYNNYY